MHVRFIAPWYFVHNDQLVQLVFLTSSRLNTKIKMSLGNARHLRALLHLLIFLGIIPAHSPYCQSNDWSFFRHVSLLNQNGKNQIKCCFVYISLCYIYHGLSCLRLSLRFHVFSLDSAANDIYPVSKNNQTWSCNYLSTFFILFESKPGHLLTSPCIICQGLIKPQIE